MEFEADEVTELLRRIQDGDESANNDLFTLVYPWLRKLARSRRARWSGDYTMSTTAILHEAYIKLTRSSSRNWKDRAHFFRVAARAIKQVLQRHREEKHTIKRGGGKIPEEFQDSQVAGMETAEDIAALEEALSALETQGERSVRVFECRRLAGLSVEQTAKELGISPMTVKRESRFIESWLRDQIKSDSE